MDGNYQSYINRVVQMTLPANYEQQLKNIQSSPKFDGHKPVSFPGYTIITPPNGESQINKEFYQKLSNVQSQLEEKLGKDIFISVPADSFHLTMADLIWNDLYLCAVEQNPNFDQLLIDQIETIFQEYQQKVIQLKPLEFEILGLSVFPRAISVCLSPTEESYAPIVKLRQLIYQDEKIVNIGIEQNYEFVAHITIGYFGKIDESLNLKQVELAIKKINEQWLDNAPAIFTVNKLELRKFTDMNTYIRENNWAFLHL